MGQSTHIPLKVNTGGVIPIIFASSILAFPTTLAGMFKSGGWVRFAHHPARVWNAAPQLLYVVLIIFFAYFYTAIVFNPDDVAENMRKYEASFPASARASGPLSTSTPS